MTGAVTSARAAYRQVEGEGKVWPVRGARVEGGTEGLGPGEPSIAAAAEAEAGTWTGSGSAGAEDQEARSAGAVNPCRFALQ